jgi:hypothetical protein
MADERANSTFDGFVLMESRIALVICFVKMF